MTEYKKITGVLWSIFDKGYGPTPMVWTPNHLPDELLFVAPVRSMSTYSEEIYNRTNQFLLSIIPFPEFELYAISDAFFLEEVDNQVNVISIFLPISLMGSSWIDVRQLQGIFRKHIRELGSKKLSNNKIEALVDLAKEIDQILHLKGEGANLRKSLNRYLDSYFFSAYCSDERQILQTQIITILRLLDRVFIEGDVSNIINSLNGVSFILEQELHDDLITLVLSSSPIDRVSKSAES